MLIDGLSKDLHLHGVGAPMVFWKPMSLFENMACMRVGSKDIPIP